MRHVIQKQYKEMAPLLGLAQKDLDRHLARAPTEWYRSSRVKSLESVSQKLQTGRFKDLASMEDLVGAMIVVPTAADIPTAETFLQNFFVERYRRPSAGPVKKASSSFQFDDLRLFGSLTNDESLPKPAYADMPVEIQIKTFLQHAWAIATHDLIYKYERVSWARSRVAFQVKALLEHAELSISAIDALEKSPSIAVHGKDEVEQQALIDYIVGVWNPDFLPRDLRRLVESVFGLGRRFKLATSELIIGFYREAEEFYSGYPYGYDPYDLMVLYLCKIRTSEMRTLLKKQPSDTKAFYVAVDEQILRSVGLTASEASSAVIV